MMEELKVIKNGLKRALSKGLYEWDEVILLNDALEAIQKKVTPLADIPVIDPEIINHKTQNNEINSSKKE